MKGMGTGKKRIAYFLSLTLGMSGMLGAGVSWGAASAGSDPVAEALKGDWGQIKINLRYRWEHVDQDGLKTTDGDPIRLRLGYLTPKFSGLQGYVEFEGTTPVFANDYNDKANGKTDYAVIADPAEGELNQLWLAYDAIPATSVKAGRQRIKLDNQRFIGPVGWRQMEQTFDAVRLINTGVGNLSLQGIYVWNVRSILSKDVNMNSPLLRLSYDFSGIGSLVGYGYWLDYDDPDDSGPFAYAFSTQTYGLRFTGKTQVADNLKALYTAEYAFQSDYQDNPEDYTASYYHFIAGLVVPETGSLFSDLTGQIAYEVLGADNGVSFKTPLGTNHAFNGWADLFLTTPPDGLRDLYAKIGCTVAGAKVALVYHDFQADEGSADYGTEFDATVSRKFGGHYTVQAVYAAYNADEYKVDTDKFWLQLTIAF